MIQTNNMSKTNQTSFQQRRDAVMQSHQALLQVKNTVEDQGNGLFDRWKLPVVTPEHVPLEWRYDFDESTNPFFMERIGVNATFNPGAIFHDGKFCLVVRVEGYDRKSYFGIAQSETGVDQFVFRSLPELIPETDVSDTNIYDMRLTTHEDGFIYGLFCTERKDTASPNDLSAAIAQCGIVRSKDLKTWQRLPDLKTNSAQQRNVVLHPEFIDGKYALYTRPQDGFIEVGGGGGIGWGLTESMEAAVVDSEIPVDVRHYHTIKELKNGQGPPPLKTEKGWLHLAHGVRGTAAGLRYVLYLFLTDLDEPWRIIAAPGGYFMAPVGLERVGDVSNVLFSNGWVSRGNKVFIYYASSDTRTHVATTTIEQLLDYATGTPNDLLRSSRSVDSIRELAEANHALTRSREGLSNG